MPSSTQLRECCLVLCFRSAEWVFLRCETFNTGEKPENLSSGKLATADFARIGKEAAMKRIIMSFVWFVILYFGIAVLGGGIVGAIEGAKAGSGEKSFSQGFNQRYQAGHTGGQEFGTKYASLILFFAFGGAVVGTFTGRLPGTRPKAK